VSQKEIIALDLGTTKFCLAILRQNMKTKTFRIDSIAVNAQGMKRGMVADTRKAGEALRKLIELGEKQFKTDIRRVAVGIAGSHLRSLNCKRSTEIHQKTIDQNLLFQLAKIVEDQYSVAGRELLHCVPVAYRIDQRQQVESPIGMSGKTLSGTFFLIDSDKSYLKDVVKLCNQSGLEVAKLYAEPFASASVTLDDTKKKNGVALVDIGGGTSDGIIFNHGKPIFAFTANIAGHLMTQDLSLGLRISPEEAEKVKFFFGVEPIHTHGTQQNVLEVKNIKGHSLLLTWKDVFPMIAPRIDELASHLNREIAPFKSSLQEGMLLTGGGANCKGICERLSEKLNLDVTTIAPAFQTIKNLLNSYQFEYHSDISFRHATVLGLLNLELGRIKSQEDSGNINTPSKYISFLWNWLKDLN